MLLVHNHELEVLYRGEYRRTGTHHDMSFTTSERLPSVVTLSLRQMAMPDNRMNATRFKSRANAPDSLRREGNFGHQKNHTTAFSHDFFDGIEVDFCLARSSDTMEQAHAECFGGDGLMDGSHSDILFLRQHRACRSYDGLLIAEFVLICDTFFLGVSLAEEALSHEAITGRSADLHSFEDVGAR